ncbi:MAG: radical SAM family heme chaperone HemW [Erysipelotrichaceae bacterium]
MIESLYLHVPFCQDICAYCDFTRVKIHPILVEKYLLTLFDEIKAIPKRPMKTLYLGGGTPSALANEELEALLAALEGYHDSATEFTMEANPDSLTSDKVELMVRYGINRVSMGVQTFDAEELALLNRTHTAQDIENAIFLLHRHGIHNLSIDLIYGLPRQTLESWEATLRHAVSLEISHISLYSLTIEEHSKFGRKGIKQCDGDLEAAMYFKAVQILGEHGFDRYEISSFTKDTPSRHNLAYWHYDEFYGLGPGATEMTNHRRIVKTTNLDHYAKGKTIGEITELSFDDEQFEFIMMGLRLTEGIDLDRFETRFHLRAEERFADAIRENIAKKRLVMTTNRLTCSDEGLAMLNDVLLNFLPDTP